jgi:hypothetical protein
MISEKSKSIKKTEAKKFEESLRFVKEKDGKFSVKKLRGKTLDLTEMGILRKKLDVHLEVGPRPAKSNQISKKSKGIKKPKQDKVRKPKKAALKTLQKKESLS